MYLHLHESLPFSLLYQNDPQSLKTVSLLILLLSFFSIPFCKAFSPASSITPSSLEPSPVYKCAQVSFFYNKQTKKIHLTSTL